MVFVIWGDLWFSLELLIANTKDIPNSINVHCWTGSGGPMSSSSLSPMPLRCILGQLGAVLPSESFQLLSAVFCGNRTLRAKEIEPGHYKEKCSGSQTWG